MKVAKWGNSLAVRLPRALVEALSLKEGDEVDLRPSAANAGAMEVVKDRSREEALARLRSMRAPLPPGYRFDRDEIYDRPRGDSRPDPDAADES